LLHPTYTLKSFGDFQLTVNPFYLFTFFFLLPARRLFSAAGYLLSSSRLCGKNFLHWRQF
jgi:hypothetical protein